VLLNDELVPPILA